MTRSRFSSKRLRALMQEAKEVGGRVTVNLVTGDATVDFGAAVAATAEAEDVEARIARAMQSGGKA
jgi:hypothetical protein